jgi:hypothetical protein
VHEITGGKEKAASALAEWIMPHYVPWDSADSYFNFKVTYFVIVPRFAAAVQNYNREGPLSFSTVLAILS